MARVLVKRDVRKAVRRANDPLGTEDEDILPDGHMRLYSYFKPSLKAGLYGIEAKQVVTAGVDKLNIWNYQGDKVDLSDSSKDPKPDVVRQTFQVQAPQFNIDPKLINTIYPPAGHQDEGRILPHIVFNDPHVPWLREAGIAYNFLQNPIDPDRKPSKNGKNLVPWLALVTFDPEELVITPEDAYSIGLAVKGPKTVVTTDPVTGEKKEETVQVPVPLISSYDDQKLPSNGAYQMTVGDYLTKIPTHRVYYQAGYALAKDNPDPNLEPKLDQDYKELTQSVDMTSVIFPKYSLLKRVFGEKNSPGVNESDAKDRIFEGQKLMAHVRHVNTLGFPDAGVEEEGWFSVIISTRTGPVRNTVPHPQVVHLVSLEHWDSTLGNQHSPVKGFDDNQRIGMVSLHSWSYSCIPEAVNFVDAMNKISKDMQPLKPPQEALKKMLKNSENTSPALGKAAKLLHTRLDKSYTLSRWRTATGEETVAFNRGPLVGAPTPQQPALDPQKWPKLSMTGKDYQIYDRDLGIMDLTYSSAWSLGKLAAISDSPFNAALLRFRSLIWTKAASNTRYLTNGIPKAASILAKTTGVMRAARSLPTTFSGEVSRINPVSHDDIAPPLADPAVAPLFTKAVTHAVDRYTSVTNGSSIYNDFNLAAAANSDWELIHSWISDTLYLAHIPAHYIFPDPSSIRAQPETDKAIVPNLPPEALRFFFIDHAWLDAFIDGALSCANHLEPDFDSTRLRVKEVYNYYLSSNINSLEGKTPPIPRFGFIFRSMVVKAIPDLKIIVRCWKFNPVTSSFEEDVDGPLPAPRNPVLRLTKMDEFTILCLLDCLPEEIQEIKISQPPHQQRYSMGTSLKPDLNNKIQVDLEVKMLYTDATAAPQGQGEKGVWPLLPGKLSHNPELPPDKWEQPSQEVQNNFWDEDSRLIRPILIAETVTDKLTKSKAFPNMYQVTTPDSCVIGLELNDPAYSLIIRQPPATLNKDDKPEWKPPTRTTDWPKWTRQLWTGPAPDPAPFEPDGTLQPDMLPSSPLIPDTSIPPTSITLPNTPTPSQPTIPRPPLLHTTPIISLPPFKMTTAPSSSISGPQFTLQIHVDYRPPPPTPRLQNDNSVCYAPLDYLPTQTTNLYDLIFSIRRTHPSTDPKYHLSELRIEVPISPDDIDNPPPGSKIVREPLLPKNGYSGPGARMVRNQRFVPTLYNSTDAGGLPILGIKLIPRSGTPDATISVRNDGKTHDLSVRLAEVPIARVRDARLVSIAQVDKDGKGLNNVKMERRGVVGVVLREVYLVEGRKVSWVTTGDTRPGDRDIPIPLVVVKKESGDVDLDGLEV